MVSLFSKRSVRHIQEAVKSLHRQKMLRMSVWLLVCVCVSGFCGFVSCDIRCPDGLVCPDAATCCVTSQGYSCCPYPNAVCCSDLAHCCPSGFGCNLATQMCEKVNQPWMKVAMVKKESYQDQKTPLTTLTEAHSKALEAGVIRCDSKFYCSAGRTCCKGLEGQWNCCPYPLGQCCADGRHCCEYGYSCDPTSYSCRTWNSQIH